MKDKLVSVLVVNLNNLDYTKRCLQDLLNQDEGFFLRLVDQNSSETGTSEFLDHVENLETGENVEIEIIKNLSNVPLNHLWNKFVEETKTPFICFLNNDVLLSPNFISSAVEVFNESPEIAFVNHVTNNKEYKKWSKKLKYEIINFPYRQGWDPIFRRENYFKIPEEIKFFYGDDYIYSKMYSSGFKGAYVLNSPMIHFERSTTAEKGGQRDCSEDGGFFHSLDLEFKNLTFVETLSKWKPEFSFIDSEGEGKEKVYITHVTRDYLEVAFNLAKSIRTFSEIPLLVYCLNLEEKDYNTFSEIKGVYVRNLSLDIDEGGERDYVRTSDGNFYVNRSSERIYRILCAKTIAMEMALEEGWKEVCYLDSDCIATPLVDEIFQWSSIIRDYPIATEGIHEYMLIIKDGVQIGNPFEGTWPVADNTKSLEWPLMNFLEMSPESRGRYRTTGIMLMNQKCLSFIKTWRELCFILPKLVNLERYAPYHEETIYNVLSWKKTNEGFPLCYVNIGEGLETVKHTYSDSSDGGDFSWDDENHSKRFYMIPNDKRSIKVLHGEKRSSEVNLILEYLKNIK